MKTAIAVLSPLSNMIDLPKQKTPAPGAQHDDSCRRLHLVNRLVAVNISSVLARGPGWQYAAMTFSAISAVLMVAWGLVVRDAPTAQRIGPAGDGLHEEGAAGSGGRDGGRGDGEAGKAALQRAGISLSEAAKTRTFWTTATSLLLAMWTYAGVLEQLQPMLLAEGIDAQTVTRAMISALRLASGTLHRVAQLPCHHRCQAVSIVSATATCGILGKLGSGLLSEKITARYTPAISEHCHFGHHSVQQCGCCTKAHKNDAIVGS